MTDEEKLEEIRKQVNGYYNTLYIDYDDEEYRMFFYNMVEKLKKILDS